MRREDLLAWDDVLGPTELDIKMADGCLGRARAAPCIVGREAAAGVEELAPRLSTLIANNNKEGLTARSHACCASKLGRPTS